MPTSEKRTGGSWNAVLRIDLTSQTAVKEELSDEVLRLVVGGAGLGAYYLYRDGRAEAGALDPDNLLTFATGPLQSTALPGSAKWTVASRSPLSGFYGESAAGGDWGVGLKKTGFDAIVISGSCKEPVYLVVKDGQVQFHPAKHLWGQTTSEARQQIIQEVEEPKLSVAVIGPAGENLVRYACIIVDHHSAAGRTGMGAVMGSKKLKAICVTGGNLPEAGDTSRVKELRKKWIPAIRERTARLNTIGTPGFFPTSESLGNIPTKNWAWGVWPEGNEKLGPSEYKRILTGPVACLYCPVGCHRAVKVEKPAKYSMEGSGPEYETLCLIGQNCLIDNLPAICKLNEACNEYGLDTISAGSCIAFTMECFEKGFLGKEDNEGSTVDWGDADAALDLLNKITMRVGLGDILAEGSTRAARAIDSRCIDFAVAVKGIDLPGHNPRSFWAHAINYATGARGACHERGNLTMPYLGLTIPELGINAKQEQFTMDGVPRLAAKAQDWSSLWNSLVVCRFMGFSFSDMVESLNAATGWDMEIEEAARTAERIFNLQRLVNMKFGATKEDDRLPKRIFESVEEGPLAGKKIPDLEPVLCEYYMGRGWDSKGVPTAKTLQRLGIDELMENSNC